LPPASAPEVAKAIDEIQFRSEFKKRLTPQLSAWIDKKSHDDKSASLPAGKKL
jgi:hypothetical protein